MPPDLEGIAAAAESMREPKPDNSIPIVDPPASAKGAYPISTFTYAIGPGQEFAEQFVFAKLPAEVVELNKKTIASIG